MAEDSVLLAQRLRVILEERDMTVNRLATLAGMAQSSLNAIFTRESSSPRLGTIHKIANGLGMSVTDLLDFPPYNQRPDGSSAAKRRSMWEELGNALTPEERERVRNILLNGIEEARDNE